MTVDGQAQPVPLEATSIQGVRAAVVDAPFDFATPVDHLSRVQVFEADGSPSPCVQE